jgi:hypothetical protein
MFRKFGIQARLLESGRPWRPEILTNYYVALENSWHFR